MRHFLEEKYIFNQKLLKVDPQDHKSVLHRSICAILSSDGNKRMVVGSGVLISKDLVLSCAHNFYDKLKGQEYHDTKIYIGFNGIANAKEYHEIQSIRYMQQYKTYLKQNIYYDFALIKLKKEVNYQRFLKLSLPSKEYLISNNKYVELKIFGYPTSKQSNNIYSGKVKLVLFQYGLALQNRIREIDTQNQQIYYGISTLAGQSGCPVVVDQQIIAIHIGSMPQYNMGRLIDYRLLEQLIKWQRQLKANPFSIEYKHLSPHPKKYNYQTKTKQQDIGHILIKQRQKTKSKSKAESQSKEISKPKSQNNIFAPFYKPKKEIIQKIKHRRVFLSPQIFTRQIRQKRAKMMQCDQLKSKWDQKYGEQKHSKQGGKHLLKVIKR